MPRLPRSKTMVRLSLELAEDVRKKLEELRDATNADSLAEVVRRSLCVYGSLHRASLCGEKILIERADQTRELLVPEFSRNQ